MVHEHSSDSSSSDSSSIHSSRSTNRRNRHTNRNTNRTSYGSSCGIKSLNEYQDRFIKDGPERKAESYKESRDKHGRGWAGAEATDHGNGHYSSRAYTGLTGFEKGRHSSLKAKGEANAEFGLGGAIAEAEADYTVYTYNEDNGKTELLKAYSGGGVGIGAGGAKAKVEAGVDLVNVSGQLGKNQEVNANLGLNVDTGGEIGADGVSASFLGFGGSVGRKTGIQTPFGGINFKLW